MGHTGWVYSVGFRPDGKQLVSGGEDQTIKLWDVGTGQETLSLRGHTDTIVSVGFSQDGQMVVSKDNSGKTIVWDLRTGQPAPAGIPVPTTPENNHYSPDGQLFANLDGPVIRLLGPLTAEEIDIRRRLVRPNRAWHQAILAEARDAGLWFAALFHMNRLLSLENPRDVQAALKLQRKEVLLQAIQHDPRDGLAWTHYLVYSPQWQRLFGLWPRP
jgi:hypothetical protein